MKNFLTKIIAVVAVSIDGKIALSNRHFTGWTSPEDKKNLHMFLNKSNVIVVGNNTYKIAKKPLLKRNCIVLTRSISGIERHNDNLLFCNPDKINIKTILKNYKTVAVLGGAQTYTYFLDNNLLDEIYLTIEPLIFGKGLNIFKNATNENFKFKLLSVKKLNQKGTLLLHYKNI